VALKHPPQADSPKRVPRRTYTDADLRRQQAILLYGGNWDDQYDIPARPWSQATEQFCEAVGRDLELEDWWVARRRD
jgi:hypothetical protein